MSLVKILLKEFQGKNYLYHFTSADRAGRIIDDNKLKASESLSSGRYRRKAIGREDPDKYRDLNFMDTKEGYQAVSFTRNRRLPAIDKSYIGGSFGRMVLIGFVFDRNKIQSNYKLVKFDVHDQSPRKKKHRGGRGVLDEEMVFSDIDNIRSRTEFLYISKEYSKEYVHDPVYYIHELLKFYRTYHRYFDFKTFDKGNFQPIELDIDQWDGTRKNSFDRDSIEYKLYTMLFR